MQTQNKLFDDLARVANGAVSTVMGMKDEIDAMVRQRLERFMCDANLVSREEFDVVKAMAGKARTENDKLEARIAKLEAALAQASKSAKPARSAPAKAQAKPKSASKAKTAPNPKK